MHRTTTPHSPDDQFRRPDGWGEDEVTAILSRVATNMFCTTNRNRARVRRLRTAMKLFLDGINRYAAIRGGYPLSERRFQGMDCVLPFYMSCRVSLYAATTLTFGNQLGDAAKSLRGAVEAAFYAHHVFTHPDAWERWASRPVAADLRNAATREAVRRKRSAVGREFSVPMIAREFKDDVARLASVASDLYEELIDVGGHFNVPVFQAGTEMVVRDRTAEIRFTVVGGDDRDIAEALDRLIKTACTCLRVFNLIFAEFWDEPFSQRIGALAAQC